MKLTKQLAVLSALVVLAGVGSASAGDTAKAARGIVTSIGGGSIAINLPSDTDVTFRVDPSTHVVARGAGTKMRQAQAQGAPGVKLADVLPIGTSVEVRYEERDGQRIATRIVSIAAAK
jgi:hypothetical protein